VTEPAPGPGTPAGAPPAANGDQAGPDRPARDGTPPGDGTPAAAPGLGNGARVAG
jgi:hypothetical protein